MPNEANLISLMLLEPNNSTVLRADDSCPLPKLPCRIHQRMELRSSDVVPQLHGGVMYEHQLSSEVPTDEPYHCLKVPTQYYPHKGGQDSVFLNDLHYQLCIEKNEYSNLGFDHVS
uniref:Uncharacterized protein n=1 Tax=Sphaerodactylus townsendi TaxID=933632 RepID=A0ACB8FQP2_9SAUR